MNRPYCLFVRILDPLVYQAVSDKQGGTLDWNWTDKIKCHNTEHGSGLLIVYLHNDVIFTIIGCEDKRCHIDKYGYSANYCNILDVLVMFTDLAR